MNRYPIWKYVVIAFSLLLGVLYALPNLYGESPALQISSGKATIKVTPASVALVEAALKKNNIQAENVFYETVGTQGSIRVRFATLNSQFEAKTLLEKELNLADPADPTYLVAFNLVPNTPAWLQALYASPMYLGLDLRGGVHFMLQVDTGALVTKKLQGVEASTRGMLRDKNIRHSGITRTATGVEVRFNDAATRIKANAALAGQSTDLLLTDSAGTDNLALTITIKPEAITKTVEDGVKQNILTLSKRVNELGVAEPLIQRQGADRIVVELPGVQDVTGARNILGKTATLEVRLVDDTVLRGSELTGAIPFNSELFKVGRGAPTVVYKDPIITGDYISSASASFDENHQPAVSIDLNGDGGRKMRDATRDKIGKSMAIVLFEKGRGEVLTVATIRDVLGSSFRITGMGSAEASAELALLLRAGSRAAPMEIIQEATIGPQLGAENISKGFNSTLYGFAAIAVFMIVYYHLFGVFSVFALAVNLLLLIAILSRMQATLTLPGIAAIAFTLGMAIDANVLINERIREELRAGNSPQAAIAIGFDRAWATILDSNVTTLIAGLALLIFGSGAIRGFAVVHCIGIVTSIFSSVFISRGVANLWYGRKKKLTSLSIGQIWKPNA